MSRTKVDLTLFLRLNRHLIPGLGEVLTKLDILKNKRDTKTAESVAAKAAEAANLVTVSLLYGRGRGGLDAKRGCSHLEGYLCFFPGCFLCHHLIRQYVIP